jgi:hypothetical protein
MGRFYRKSREQHPNPTAPVDRVEKPSARWEAYKALIAAGVVILLSPFSLYLSNWLTEHFSRPIMSLEYAECYKEDLRIPIPAQAAHDFLASDGFQEIVTKEPRAFSRLPELVQGARDLSPSEYRSVQKTLQAFVVHLSERMSKLVSLKTAAEAKPPVEEARRLAAEYNGIPPDFAPLGGDASSISSDLLQKIDHDCGLYSESLELARKLTAALEGLGKDTPVRLRLKMSILNRGGTDGLIRNLGRITFNRTNLTLPIKRTGPMGPASPLSPMAVPVTVVNAMDEAKPSGSVGKVEKNSMSEFWFEVDSANLTPDARKRYAAVTSASQVGGFDVVLFDQEKHTISLTTESATALSP